MNGSVRGPALKGLYSKPRRSKAWKSENAEVVRFWTGDGDSWGFLFHYLIAIHYSARHERLLITWTLGTLVIAGPKVRPKCGSAASGYASPVSVWTAASLSMTMTRCVRWLPSECYVTSGGDDDMKD